MSLCGTCRGRILGEELLDQLIDQGRPGQAEKVQVCRVRMHGVLDATARAASTWACWQQWLYPRFLKKMQRNKKTEIVILAIVHEFWMWNR